MPSWLGRASFFIRGLGRAAPKDPEEEIADRLGWTEEPLVRILDIESWPPVTAIRGWRGLEVGLGFEEPGGTSDGPHAGIFGMSVYFGPAPADLVLSEAPIDRQIVEAVRQCVHTISFHPDDVIRMENGKLDLILGLKDRVLRFGDGPEKRLGRFPLDKEDLPWVQDLAARTWTALEPHLEKGRAALEKARQGLRQPRR